jgi:hypothetical protein
VSGTNYKTTYEYGSSRYEVIVYDQPWTNTTEIKSFVILPGQAVPSESSAATTTGTSTSSGTSSSPSSSSSSSSSSSQSTSLPGGYQPLTNYESDPDWQKADQLARSTYPAQLGNASVVSVNYQIVSGKNYETNYKNGNDTYQVVVYSQPWTNTLNITSFKQTGGTPTVIVAQIGNTTITATPVLGAKPVSAPSTIQSATNAGSSSSQTSTTSSGSSQQTSEGSTTLYFNSPGVLAFTPNAPPSATSPVAIEFKTLNNYANSKNFQQANNLVRKTYSRNLTGASV